MGFFRQSSNSRTTATIPASTTLSARPRPVGRRTLFVASALVCAGVFYIASVSAKSHYNSSAAPSLRNSSHASSLRLNVDQRSTTHAQNTNPDPAGDGTHVTTNSSTAEYGSGTTAPTANLTVNGQAVEVPTNGSVNKTISNENGQTTVQVTTSNNDDTANASATSLQVNVSTHSDTSSDSSP